MSRNMPGMNWHQVVGNKGLFQRPGFIGNEKARTHIETRTHNKCGDTIEKSQATDDGCINVRNMLSIEELE